MTAVTNESTEPIVCLLADDHPAILKSMAAFLLDEGFRIAGTALTGSETLNLLRSRRADVLLLDHRLPDITGLGVIRRAAEISPGTAIVLYTGYADPALAREALDLGARGIVLKEAPLVDVVRALQLVSRGAVYLDALLGAELASSDRPTSTLTTRERQVLRYLADGLSNQEIGSRLFLSPETVRTHVRKATARLGARTRTQAVATAVREGLVL